MSKNWSEIKTGVGFATHIPEKLNLLLSPNQETRYNAYWKIDNYAIIQGDLYEASYYIIDPLMNALKDAKYKTEILDLLTEIALGFAPETELIVINDKKVSLMEACHSKLKKYYNQLVEIKKQTITPSELTLLENLLEILDELK
ncbi:hypothetical protein [Empedobacter sedimenti]|uniref:hypothetical protein n=1 Tax=Empedobacter sedimenti TaxID=3042610 RepID=UPI0024A6459B|nr:hypothetical protein [Empedobacter sedimenti]